MRNEKIDLILIVFSAEVPRPSTTDIQNLITLQECYKGLKSDNYGIVFTKCDKTNMLENVADKRKPKLKRYRDWLNEATKPTLEVIDTFKEIKDERVFLCSFKEGGQTQNEATTRHDLMEWIKKIVPEQASLEHNQKASVANIAMNLSLTGDDMLMKNLVNDIEGMMKEHRKDPEASPPEKAAMIQNFSNDVLEKSNNSGMTWLDDVVGIVTGVVEGVVKVVEAVEDVANPIKGFVKFIKWLI